MRACAILVFAAITFSTAATAQAPRHLNPVVDLLSQKTAVFGLYAPANRRPGRGGGTGAATADTTPVKTPAQLAKDALANQTADYLFDGTMEGNFERGYGPFVEFMVRDNGQGIAPQYHERIFGIFQTLEARDKVEGTGIGLSVVQKIVEAKGGRVWVESDVGKGARFKFLWPRTEVSGA